MSTSHSKNEEQSIIDINRMLKQIPNPTDKHQSFGVCVCSVPRFFSSAKPEAFSPRLVGLGPYHHSNAKLAMTDELKLGVAKRVLNVYEIIPEVRSDHFTFVEGSYHADLRFTYNPPTFVYILTVDGLFLLALLHNSILEGHYSSYYIFTGKQYGMTMDNTAGEELTMDGVIRDVFMLENQIPTLVLKHIIEVNFHNNHIDLGSVMLNFCKAYSPLVHSADLHQSPQAHNHLLDLMYYLVAPDHPQPELEPELDSFLFYGMLGMIYLNLSLRIFFCTWVYVVVSVVLPFLRLICFVLVKVIPWSGAILDQPEMEMPNLPYFLSSVLELLLYNTFTIKPIFLSISPKSYSRIIGVAGETTRRLFQRMDSTNPLDKISMIPSVTELHNANIRFKPVERDISSIEFDEITREFYLPCIKLDATSEVILRNLAVYESLIKNDSLNFSSYIELMRGLVCTPEDAKILVNEKIILTQLSAEVVAQIFKIPIGKLIGRPTTKIQTLEGQLKKIKPKLDAIQNINLIFNAFLRICVICGIICVFSPLLVQAFQQIWCSTIFGNTSGSCKRHQVGDYGRNNYYVSSM